MTQLPMRFISAVLLTTMSVMSIADVITVQGQLVDEQATPWTGLIPIEFTIYDAPSGGSALWAESLEVDVLNGVFTITLGTILPLEASLFESPDQWLGLNMGGVGEQSERFRLSASTVAIRATVTESVAPTSINGSLLVTGAVTLDKLAPCNPGEIIVMDIQGWACKVPGANQ